MVNTDEWGDADLKAGLWTEERIVLQDDVPTRSLPFGARPRSERMVGVLGERPPQLSLGQGWPAVRA